MQNAERETQNAERETLNPERQQPNTRNKRGQRDKGTKERNCETAREQSWEVAKTQNAKR